jgi:uncharacterized repeat protein (TIGR01451 family)
MRANRSLRGLRRTASAAGVTLALLTVMVVSAPAWGSSSVTAETVAPAETTAPEAPVEPEAPAEPVVPAEPMDPAVPAAPTDPTTPQLSISVSDDADAAGPGDELTYTTVVANLGTSDVLDLTVTQTVPEGLEFTAADNGGALTSSLVSWTVSVTASQSVTLSTTMTAGDTPEELLRLAVVACALVAPTEPPVVCASDSDILPAGVAAEKAAKAPAQSDDQGIVWIIAASAGAVLVIAAVVLILRRRRNASPRSQERGNSP